jgi:hypothetical protein
MSNIFAWIIVVLDLLIAEYNREEYGQFRERNRAYAAGQLKSLFTRCAKTAVETAEGSYYLHPFTQTAKSAWAVWNEIGETNFVIFETALMVGAVVAAFLVALCNLGVEKFRPQAEAEATEEGFVPQLKGFVPFGLLAPAAEPETEIEAAPTTAVGTAITCEGFVPFALLSPVAEVEIPAIEPPVTVESLKATFKTLAKAKKALGSKAKSWKALVAEVNG